MRRERAAARKEARLEAEFHRREMRDKSFFDESIVDEHEMGYVASDGNTTTIATEKWRKWVVEEKIRRRVLEKEIKKMNAVYMSWIESEKDKSRRLQDQLDALATKKAN